jgi:predicted membrane metal-binding protein
MLALFWGREINIRRLLSMSAIIMLIVNPYFLVYDVGFLLSYSALIGLIYFSDEVSQDFKSSTASGPPPLSLTGVPSVSRRKNGGEVEEKKEKGLIIK